MTKPMNNRRMMVMRELGLTPVYLLRREGATDTQKPPETRGEQAAANIAEWSEDTEAYLQTAVEETPVSGEYASDASPLLEPAALTPSSSPPTSSIPSADADRRNTVIRMDWPELKAAVASCVTCRLHAGRNKTVFGVGDEKASWLFVGEGPGADEDRQGEPFVGQAGKLLDNMLAAIDLKRGEDVYIANIVKCRPPGNRNPQPDEAQSCEPYLTRQIQLIKPKLIVALGKVAAQNLLNTDAAVGSLRGGRLHKYKDIPLIVTYHPAYLLRNPMDKARVWEDLCFARSTMANLKSAVAAS